MTPAITIIHPSRSRPKQALQAIREWHLKAHKDYPFQYVLSLDIDDPSIAEYTDMVYSFHLMFGFEIKIILGENKSAIAAINKAADFITTGDLIVVVSDDFSCPEFWNKSLIQALSGKSDFIVKTQDGYQPTLITLPIMDRAYYNRFGYVYHPEYKHLWCDTEMTAVGYMLDKIVTLDLLFPHNHHSLGKSPKDDISIKNDRTWKQGEDLFHKRALSNFGLTNPVKPLPDWIDQKKLAKARYQPHA